MAYARPFYRSSRLQHLAGGLALGLSLVLVASTCGDATDIERGFAAGGGVQAAVAGGPLPDGAIPLDLDVQVIPGDCDSTGAEAYRIPYGPDETPPDGARDRVRVVIRTCCCCDSSYTPLGLLRGSSSDVSSRRPRVKTPGEVASRREVTPRDRPAPIPKTPILPISPQNPQPFAPIAASGVPAVPVSATITPATRVPWWLGLLAIPAGLFVIERMPEGTMCDDSGPAVGPNRESCDLPPFRSPQT